MTNKCWSGGFVRDLDMLGESEETADLKTRRRDQDIAADRECLHTLAVMYEAIREVSLYWERHSNSSKGDIISDNSFIMTNTHI